MNVSVYVEPDVDLVLLHFKNYTKINCASDCRGEATPVFWLENCF